MGKNARLALLGIGLGSLFACATRAPLRESAETLGSAGQRQDVAVAEPLDYQNDQWLLHGKAASPREVVDYARQQSAPFDKNRLVGPGKPIVEWVAALASVAIIAYATRNGLNDHSGPFEPRAALLMGGLLGGLSVYRIFNYADESRAHRQKAAREFNEWSRAQAALKEP